MNYRKLQRGCWRKRAFSTSREAQREIKRVYRMHQKRIYKYRCSGCGEYHVTKQVSAKGKII